VSVRAIARRNASAWPDGGSRDGCPSATVFD